MRIVGVDLPREKRVKLELTYIYGIGRKTSNDILKNAGINPDTRVKDLTEADAALIRAEMGSNILLKVILLEITMNIKRLREIEKAITEE